MSTLAIMEEITARKEKILHDAILARLVHDGRILPGEELAEIRLVIGNVAGPIERYTFPDYERTNT